MNKTIYIFIALACMMASCAQKEHAEEVVTEPKEEVIEVPTYKLYPTENIWNFLKLNTATGQISIVQYTVNDDDKRFEYALNNQPLISSGEILKAGRFELTPTQNRWNFILLDRVSGQAYQVQWSFEEENRFVIPIH